MGLAISVVIPTFNRAAFIAETIESILNQTHPPAEVIVVDDGSTDETGTVISRYRNSVRYCRIDNSGPSRARNVGVSLSLCPWIAFCDSDDVWLPTKLECQARLHTTFPDVEYSFTDFAILDSHGRRADTKFSEAPPGFWDKPSRSSEGVMWIYDIPILDRILQFQPIFPSTLLISKDRFLKKQGYNETFSRVLGEDLEFTLRNVVTPPIGVLAEALVSIRKHGSNTSGNWLDVLLGEVKILEHAIAIVAPEANGFAELIEDQIRWRRTLAVDRAFASGKLDIVRELAAGLGSGRYSNWKVKAKIAVAKLPWPIARIAHRALVANGVLSRRT